MVEAIASIYKNLQTLNYDWFVTIPKLRNIYTYTTFGVYANSV